MKRKIMVSIPILCLLASIGSVFADWSQDYQTGDWNICERTHWKKLDAVSSGEAGWHNTVNDFTGYRATINVTEIYTRRREWWHESATEAVSVFFNFTDASGVSWFYIKVYMYDYQKMWGGQWGKDVWGFCEANASDYEHIHKFQHSDDLAHYPDGYVEVLLYKEADGVRIKVFNYNVHYQRPQQLTSYYWGVNASWFDEVILTIDVVHEGSGRFDMKLADEIHTTVWTPDIPEKRPPQEQLFWGFAEGLRQVLADVLPDWMWDWIGTITAWGNWFWENAGNFFSILKTVIPYLPLIIVFYVLDVGISAVMTGNFKLMGQMVFSFWQVFSGTVQVIISALHTIYSFIHFW